VNQQDREWVEQRARELHRRMARIPPRAWLGWNDPRDVDPFADALAYWHGSAAAYREALGREPFGVLAEYVGHGASEISSGRGERLFSAA
jgi:hypothetical protein